jgi:hypothetical protein
MLRKLIEGHLQCEPYEVDGRRGFRFYGTGTYGRLFSETKEGLIFAKSPALHHLD